MTGAAVVDGGNGTQLSDRDEDEDENEDDWAEYAKEKRQAKKARAQQSSSFAGL